MRAGFGTAEITPPLGVELAGYGYYLERRAERKEDPLFARAAVFEEKENKYIVISCDCLGLSREIADSVRKTLEKDWDVPPDHVIIVSIHTHTGPAMINHEGCGVACPDYTATVAGKIILAAEDALRDLSPVERLQYVSQALSNPCAYNRAWAQNPVDQFARAFWLQRKNAKTIVLASYACHAVCQGVSRGISADYPGKICEKLALQGVEAMYLNGLCGDIDPVPCAPEERPARLKRFADSVCEAVNAPKIDLPLTVFGGKTESQVRLLHVTKEDISRIADTADRGETNPPGGGKVARAWEKEMLEGYDGIRFEEAFDVRYLCLGGVLIAALPFEGYTKTGMLIRDALQDQRALVLGCADQLLGYLPTADDIDRHSYASMDASFLYHRLPSQKGEAERIGQDLGEKLSLIMGGKNDGRAAL